MILLVDINPRLERRLSGGDFPKGKVSFAKNLSINASGVGADLARLSINLNEDTGLMCFLGGFNGDLFGQKFVSTQIRLLVEKLRDETQEVICLEEKNKETLIQTKEPRLTREDVTNFYQTFKESLKDSEVVLVCPNSRRETPDEMELAMVRLARASSVPIILSYNSKMDLKEVMESRPYGIVLSRQDLEAIVGKEMHYIGEVIENIKKHFKDSFPYVFLTGSKKGAILYREGKVYFGHLGIQEELDLDVNRSMLGLAAGISRQYSPEMTLSLAIATGKRKEELNDFASIKAEMNRLEIEIMEG